MDEQTITTQKPSNCSSFSPNEEMIDKQQQDGELE